MCKQNLERPSLPKGSTFTNDAGQAVTEPLLPPRPVAPPPGTPAGTVALSIGLVDSRVNLSVPTVLQVTKVAKSTSDGGTVPQIYLLVRPGPPAVFELAGITGTLDGISYLPGGVKLQETELGDKTSRYVIGVLLTHFSDFVVSSADLIPDTAPGVPRVAAATLGNTQAPVTWLAPLSDGGTVVTGYKVTSSPSSPQSPKTVGNVLATTMTGLTNGTAYTFTVQAINSVDTGNASAASSPVTPASVALAPPGITVSIGDKQSIVSWSAPVSDGGSAITGYKITSSPSSSQSPKTVWNVLSVTMTELTNLTTYTFTIQAINPLGTGAAGTSSAVTPAAASRVPDSPTGAAATAGNLQATVTWSAPSFVGGSPITGYTVTSSPDSKTSTVGGSLRTAVVSGLKAGTSYTFTVKATNGAGASTASAASSSITLVAGVTVTVTAPSSPLDVQATAGDKQATVTWSAPVSDGGAAIVQYSVISNPGAQTATVSSSTFTAVVTGLTNGVSYTFTVTATNGVGPGASSAPSDPAIPQAPVVPGLISQATVAVSAAVETVVETPDKELAVTVPANSLPAELALKTVEVRVRNLDPATAPPPPTNTTLVRVIQIDSIVDGVETSVAYTQAVKLTFPITQAEIDQVGGDTSLLVVLRFNDATGQYDQLATTFVAGPPAQLEATVTNFSLFAIGAQQPVATPTPETPTPTVVPPEPGDIFPNSGAMASGLVAGLLLLLAGAALLRRSGQKRSEVKP